MQYGAAEEFPHPTRGLASKHAIWMHLTRKVALCVSAGIVAAVSTVVGSEPASAEHSYSRKEAAMPIPEAEVGVTVSVKGTNWGGGKPRDINTLLGNVARHLTEHLRDTVDAVTEINYGPNYPIILVRPPGTTSYTIFLTANGTRWAQYSYQFAHEFCHLLSGYEQLHGSANNWFHEAICEMASLFTLKSMGESWNRAPPYPNWHDYAEHLTEYAENVADTVRATMPREEAFAAWLRTHEAEGRQNPYEREGNLLVALRMLPIFERTPEAWNAVTSLPASDAALAPYMEQWKSAADPRDREFIGLIQEALGGSQPADMN